MNRLTAKARSTSYGWWVAIAGSFNMALTSGPTFHAQSAIFAAVEAQTGWSRTLVSGVGTFGRFGGAMLGPVEGYLADRIGAAWMMLVGLIVGGLGFLLLSQMGDSPIIYYVAYFILSLGFSAGGFVPATVAVAKWLPTRRATGIAIVLAGSSIGGFMVPAISWGIKHHGFESTMISIGVAGIVVAPAFFWALSRRGIRPETGPVDNSGDSPIALDDGSFTLREAIHTRTFWVISITHTLANLSTAAVSAHLVLHLTDIGIPDIKAAGVIPIFVGVSFFAQLLAGYLGDRIDKRYMLSVSILIQASSMIILAYATSYGGAVLFAILWGVGFGSRTPVLHALRGDYFGSRYFGSILGISSFPMIVGMTATPVLVGLAFDLQGTYRWAFLFTATTAFISAGLILFAGRPVRPQRNAVPNIQPVAGASASQA
ncbi:MAG: MFS transporter, partial [Chloroflexi bacterium]|nr:MFS transporter [Chloroflexota bacterium]